MVNPKPHTEYLIGGKKKVFYYCSKCDSLYDYKVDAKECCTPKSPFYGTKKMPSAWRV